MVSRKLSEAQKSMPLFDAYPTINNNNTTTDEITTISLMLGWFELGLDTADFSPGRTSLAAQGGSVN